MKRIYLIAVAICTMMTFTSCSDFFDEESTYVIPADKNHLGNASDTIYSVIGILNKLQAIADRTVLLGEARGDLMDITANTPKDLRALANFEVNDSNAYNSPRDYYAIINNCNYFIARVDTAMKNNRNENVFKAEFAAVKAIRAWTYLQLVTTYGKVPFVTTPILTKEEAEKEYPMKDIKGVCDYFLNEDGLQALVNQPYPNYGDIKSVSSNLFFIPMRLILGDLNLWAGNYLEAAKNYYGYIDNRNGTGSSYPVSKDQMGTWRNSNWMMVQTNLPLYANESFRENSEFITIIPMDSIPSEGYYSQIRNLMNSSQDNDYTYSLTPSKYLQNLSASQLYTYYDNENNKYTLAPNTGLEERNGDLRLSSYWNKNENSVDGNGNRYTSQRILKFFTRNIRIYRRTLVYLRLAEALNSAGYPHYAYHILRTGVNSEIIRDSIGPKYSKEDSTMLMQNFPFPVARYRVYKANNALGDANTIGIHSRGCGDYDWLNNTNIDRMPTNPALSGEELIKWQQRKIEDMLVDEMALELCFEGYRYYDLMRVAMRRNDPTYLSQKISMRTGTKDSAIESLLLDKNNWFLKWNGQIGLYEVEE